MRAVWLMKWWKYKRFILFSTSNGGKGSKDLGIRICTGLE